MVLDIHALPLSPLAPGTLIPGKNALFVTLRRDKRCAAPVRAAALRSLKNIRRAVKGHPHSLSVSLPVFLHIRQARDSEYRVLSNGAREGWLWKAELRGGFSLCIVIFHHKLLMRARFFTQKMFVVIGAQSYREFLFLVLMMKTVLRAEQLSLRDGREAVIIGGMVLDIHALPLSPPAPGTTTPGKVHYPFFISAVGHDMAGNRLLEHWRSTGCPIEGILQTQDITTAVVCCVLDPNGEVAAGVASFESIEKFLTAEWIQQFRYKISSAPVVMVDANLNNCALEASCRLAAGDNIPLWFEPVSVAKSKKIAPLVKYVTYVSPNEDELFAMADALSPGKLYLSSERYKSEKNCPPESLIKMLKPAIILLLEKGVKNCKASILTRTVVVKPQPLGVSSELHRLISPNCPSHKFHDARQIKGSSHLFALHLPGLPVSVKKLTGAGDCLVGATLASICEGLNVIQAISVGIAAAKATVEADSNVPLTFDLIGVADDARLVYSAAKVVFDGPV
ncbi:hypothetical protein NL676_038591 [Syzygium grande]|nr:hypothetical protein NL676_038591 [Syzygium grande]